MLLSELKQLQLKSEPVSIVRDCYDDELTGLICHATDNVVAMHLFTDNADYDGFTVFKTEQITEVFWGNREHKAIAYLISKTDTPATPKFINTEFSHIVIELDAQFDSACFYTGDESLFEVGKIEKYDDTWIKIKTLAVKKTLSPKYLIFLRDEITRIDVNSPYQNKLSDLHQSDLA